LESKEFPIRVNGLEKQTDNTSNRRPCLDFDIFVCLLLMRLFFLSASYVLWSRHSSVSVVTGLRGSASVSKYEFSIHITGRDFIYTQFQLVKIRPLILVSPCILSSATREFLN